jgi:cytochrome o ubiquinol oxidase operon protein cyoD
MAHHDIESDYGLGKKRLGIYSMGVLFCLILTIIPFYTVMHGSFELKQLFHLMYGCAIIQLLVQVKCFLNMNTKTPQAQYNTMSFIFTLLIILVLVGGSMWIMYHLNANMM